MMPGDERFQGHTFGHGETRRMDCVGDRPFVLGLTGSIGMGKTTVARMFEDEGVPVFDADMEVHRMQGPGGELVEAIEAAFPGTTGPEGVLRDRLGKLVFEDPDALARLEAIVHPAVRHAGDTFLADHASAPLVVFDIPLLFEKGNEADVDAVVVVSAPYAKQRKRVMARPGMTQEKFERITSLQMSDAEKRARAEYVIDTGLPLPETQAEVARLVDKLRA